MIQANNGNVAIAFAEEGVSSNGTKTRSMRIPSDLTQKRNRAENTIIQLARQSGQKVGAMVTKVLNGSVEDLQRYVQARGESPSTNPVTLGLQAALLRAIEVATAAKAIDTTDADAMEMIENAESDAVRDNTADIDNILPPDTAGAISLMLYRIVQRYKDKGGSGSLVDFVNDLRKGTKADSFDKMCCSNVASYFTGMRANGADDGFLFYTPEQEQEVTGSVTTTDTPSTWDNIFNAIDKVVDGVTKVTGAVNTTAGNVSTTTGGIIDKVKSLGSDIGSDSLAKYMSQNWLTIVAAIIAIALIIIIIVRVAKR